MVQSTCEWLRSHHSGSGTAPGWLAILGPGWMLRFCSPWKVGHGKTVHSMSFSLWKQVQPILILGFIWTYNVLNKVQYLNRDPNNINPRIQTIFLINIWNQPIISLFEMGWTGQVAPINFVFADVVTDDRLQIPIHFGRWAMCKMRL